MCWAAELDLVHGMVVLVVVGGLCKRERHCLCKVVFGRGEAGREIEGAPVETAHMSRGGASGVCSSGGKFVIYPACKKGGSFSSFAVRSSPNGIFQENGLLSVI